MLKTPRLILRQWTEDDFQPFAQLCNDNVVMEYFPNTLTEAESFEYANKVINLIETRGWGFWAVEIPNEAKFIGFVGLHTPKDHLPFAPCVEIGWRLAKEYWGKGYATEAANASLKYAFEELNLDEVVSFTTISNGPSQAVMKKIGMKNTGLNFDHPDVDEVSGLREHVLYKITRSDWKYRNS